MMSVNRKRMIPVLSIALVALMALTAVVPAFAANGTKDQYVSPKQSDQVQRVERALVAEPKPKAELHVAKIGVVDLPWYNIAYRNLGISVVIFDDSGRGIEGVEVKGQIEVSSFDEGPLAGKTDQNGLAMLETRIPRRSFATFCVTDVIKEGYVYNAKGNEMTCVYILPQQ
jgi:hypothetical protein